MFARICAFVVVVAAVGVMAGAAVPTPTPPLELLYSGGYVISPPPGTMGPSIVGTLSLGIQVPIAPKAITGTIVVDGVEFRYVGAIAADKTITLTFPGPAANAAGGKLVGKFSTDNTQITGTITLVKAGRLVTGQFVVSSRK